MNIADLITLDERQRAIPTDRESLRRAVDELRNLVTSNGVAKDGVAKDGVAKDGAGVSSLRQLGSGLTALGEYAEAQRVLERAVNLAAATGNQRAMVAARVNLGDAYRYGGDLESARDQYAMALEQARSGVPDLVDFALQHQGKYYIDAGRPDEAAVCLREALRLREGKGDPSLIRSTRDTLALISP